jgi:hypothetical protein
MADPDEDELALSHLGIVNSAPFDWGSDTPQDVVAPSSSKMGRLLVDQMPSNNTSGLDSLKKFLNSNDNNSGHQKSKDLLRSLLGSHNISISPESPVSQSSATADMSESRYNQVLIGDGDIASRDVSIRGLSDRAVAELTCEGKTSIIASILRLFDMDRESSSVSYDKKKLWPPPQPIQKDPMIMDVPRLSTAEIVRSVHLTASPGDIPAGMDSKEYTLAILHFLSSHVPFLSENESNYRKKDDDNNSYSSSSEEGWEMLRRTLPVLPLIKATNPEQSLENRVYGRVRPLVKLGQSERKQYPDSVDKDIEFRRKVLNLERIFNSSLPFPMKEFEPFVFQKYMPRRKLVPRIEGIAKEELTLMISGHIPGVKAAKAAAASSTPTQSSTTSSPAASSDANTPQSGEKSTPQSEVKPSSEELNSYMDKWVAKNAPINLMPSLKQKETIIEETGVDKKRLESWFYRARKKMKRTQETENPVPTSAGPPANSSAGVSTIPSHTTKPDEKESDSKVSVGTKSNEDSTLRAY